MGNSRGCEFRHASDRAQGATGSGRVECLADYAQTGILNRNKIPLLLHFRREHPSTFNGLAERNQGRVRT